MNINARKACIKFETDKLRSDPASLGGRLSVQEKIAAFFDDATFVETQRFVGANMSFAVDGDAHPEGIVTGYGAVNGRLVFFCAQDYARDSGALSSAGAAKIADLYAMAVKNSAPVVTVYDCDGAKLADGVHAVAAFGKILKTAADAKGVIPQIAVVTGVCSGGMAVAAQSADIVLMGGEHASLSLSPVSVLGNSGAVADAPQNGLVAASFATEAEAFAKARELLDYLPSNDTQGEVGIETADSPQRDTAAIESLVLSETYAGADLVRILADDARFCELWAGYGDCFSVGFTSVNGYACGVVAGNPAGGTTLTADGAMKAAKFIRLCDSFGIPVITVCDCDGYSAADEVAHPVLAGSVSALAMAYAGAEIPLITVIAGKLTGSAFSFLGSKAVGADMVFALPTAVISPLPVASAVEFMLNDKLAQGRTKEELIETWENEFSSPVYAAKAGYVDYICEAAELRARIAAALNMLGMKAAF
ncbi:MAG: hypothetical protein IJ766_08700 [Clostridia bacterium]|nr:hypothetical protein [Clostridia bacterium]